MERPEHPLLSPRNFWRASLYLLLLGIFSAVLVELNDEHKWISREWLAGILLLLVLAGGYRLIERLTAAWSASRETISVAERPNVRRAAALIAFVSLGPGRSSCLHAAQYHAVNGVLKHLWMVTTREGQADGLEVGNQLSAEFPDLRIHEIQFLDDKDSIPESKRVVEHLRARAIDELGIPEEQVICDFTGLTKNASAGMILACGSEPGRLQYMVPNKLNSDGRADPTAGSHPREDLHKICRDSIELMSGVKLAHEAGGKV